MLCSFATLTAKKLISLNGLTATCGSKVLDVNTTNTAITGPLVVNGAINCNGLTVTGSVTGSGITTLLGGYATNTAFNAKENNSLAAGENFRNWDQPALLGHDCFIQRRVSHCYRSDTVQ